MRSITLIAILITSSCCSTPKRDLPKIPDITFCAHDVELGLVFCSNAPPVDINQTDNWVMFDLVNFRKLMDYVDALREEWF